MDIYNRILTYRILTSILLIIWYYMHVSDWRFGSRWHPSLPPEENLGGTGSKTSDIGWELWWHFLFSHFVEYFHILSPSSPTNLGSKKEKTSSLPILEIVFPRLPVQDSNKYGSYHWAYCLSIICSPASKNLKFCFAPSLGTAPVVNPDQVDTQPVMVMDLPTAPSPPKVLPSNEDPAMQREKYQNGHGGSSTLELGNPGTSSTPTPSASHVKTTTEVPSPAEGSCSDSELYDQVLQQHCVG